MSNTKRGYVKGEFHRFLQGHHRRTRDQITQVDRGYATPCWILPNKPHPLGYVRLGNRQAHILYWEQAHGPVPEGLELDHLCRQRDCVNPAHLEPVTHAENVARSVRPERPTSCPQGHEYTEVNTYVKPAGTRSCRICLRRRGLAHYHKTKQLKGRDAK